MRILLREEDILHIMDSMSRMSKAMTADKERARKVLVPGPQLVRMRQKPAIAIMREIANIERARYFPNSFEGP